MRKRILQLHAPLVTEYMTSKLITFREDTAITEVIDTILDKNITGAPVLNDQNQVVGMIDDKDCLNVLFGSAYYNYPVGADTVASYMSNVMKFITVNDTIVGAANIFLQSTYKRLIILDEEGYLAGQISRRDVLRAIKDLKKNTW